MAPNVALKGSNRKDVLDFADKYKREFRERKLPKYKKGDSVLIQNTSKTGKMDDEFSRDGTVEKVGDNNTYLVKIGDGKFLRRHGSQLRIWPGMLALSSHRIKLNSLSLSLTPRSLW
ncbi:hypothetical protein M153_3330004408 [Pseudoloma neurophilia]|uniref:Uncharacterized protein n=1 Tax=Pseudoloma neurophilia TaxID=146866 RepID=A0A0R0M5N0_9MICR|nr:hypothetical protein M153_3330004408 [Pseudoloma neurophilia]